MAVLGFGEPIVVDGVNSGGLMGALLHYPEYACYSSGAAPGKVIYTHHKTAYMTAEEADIRKISRETEAGEARNESK